MERSSIDGHVNQGLSRPKPGTWCSIQVSSLGGMCTWPLSAVLLDSSRVRWIRSGASGTQTVAPMGCWQHRRQFNLLFYSTGTQFWFCSRCCVTLDKLPTYLSLGFSHLKKMRKLIVSYIVVFCKEWQSRSLSYSSSCKHLLSICFMPDLIRDLEKWSSEQANTSSLIQLTSQEGDCIQDFLIERTYEIVEESYWMLIRLGGLLNKSKIRASILFL